MLFEKGTMECNTSFYKNWLTYVIKINKNFPSFFFQMYYWIVSFIYMVLHFVNFLHSFMLVLLGNWSIVSWNGKKMESPNSRSLSEQKFHEVPSTSRINFPMSHSPSSKLSPLHVIYNLNGVLVATCFNRGKYQRAPSWTIVFKPWLKEFLERHIMQFQMYIWSIAQCHNIYPFSS